MGLYTNNLQGSLSSAKGFERFKFRINSSSSTTISQVYTIDTLLDELDNIIFNVDNGVNLYEQLFTSSTASRNISIGGGEDYSIIVYGQPNFDGIVTIDISGPIDLSTLDFTNFKDLKKITINNNDSGNEIFNTLGSSIYPIDGNNLIQVKEISIGNSNSILKSGNIDISTFEDMGDFSNPATELKLENVIITGSSSTLPIINTIDISTCDWTETLVSDKLTSKLEKFNVNFVSGFSADLDLFTNNCPNLTELSVRVPNLNSVNTRQALASLRELVIIRPLELTEDLDGQIQVGDQVGSKPGDVGDPILGPDLDFIQFTEANGFLLPDDFTFCGPNVGDNPLTNYRVNGQDAGDLVSVDNVFQGIESAITSSIDLSQLSLRFDRSGDDIYYNCSVDVYDSSLSVDVSKNPSVVWVDRTRPLLVTGIDDTNDYIEIEDPNDLIPTYSIGDSIGLYNVGSNDGQLTIDSISSDTQLDGSPNTSKTRVTTVESLLPHTPDSSSTAWAVSI